MIKFNYNQIESCFYNDIVRECRGIILDEDTFEPLSFPFVKFGNYGEGYTPEIDWESARVEEKIDGSIIALFYYKDSWRVSTNGMIDAFDASLSVNDLTSLNCEYENFGQLFKQAVTNMGLNIYSLDKNNTYMFELISPYNKIVVNYSKTELYHIGTRNMLTGKEFHLDIGIQQPQRFKFLDLSQTIASADKLPKNKEGYVVVDKNWNRVKVKSPTYVALHHLRGQNGFDLVSIIQLIKDNEIEEVLTYFPEYTESVNKVQSKIKDICEDLEDMLKYIKFTNFASQKEFALAVKNLKYSNFFFEWRKLGITPQDWIIKIPNHKIKEMIENEC